MEDIRLEFKVGDNNCKEYKVEAIWDSAIYAKILKSYLPGLYCLVLWKSYSKEENT